MRYIEVSGSNYEIGVQLGKHFKDYYNKEITYTKSINNVYKKIKLIEKKLQKYLPNILAEIYGRADGAELPRDAMIFLLSPELHSYTESCTDIMIKNSKHILFAHNEDEINVSADNSAIVKITYDDFFVISYTNADYLVGPTFCFNSHKMFFTSNNISANYKKTNNISRYMFENELIKTKSIDEVINLMAKINVASPFCLNVMDYKIKKLVSIEKDIKKFYITELNDKYARSNHFLHKNHSLNASPSSLFRYKKSNELLSKLDIENSKLEDLIQILNYRTKEYNESIFKQSKENNLSKTVALFATDTASERVLFKDYISNESYIFDYDGNLISHSPLDNN